MRNFKINLDGIVTIDAPIIHAKRKLKNYTTGICLIQAWNGSDLFIKENNKIRESTFLEWAMYWKFKKDKKKIKSIAQLSKQ